MTYEPQRERLKAVEQTATDLVWTIRTRGLEAALRSTMTWDRRKVLDVALALADRHVPKMVVEAPTSAVARVMKEDAEWSDGEARAAHNAKRGGEDSEWSRTGSRIHQRRMTAKRRKAQAATVRRLQQEKRRREADDRGRAAEAARAAQDAVLAHHSEQIERASRLRGILADAFKEANG